MPDYTRLNPFRLVMAQLNFLVGDIDGNTSKIISAITEARDTLDARVIVFSELAVSGYPPEDLLHRPAFIDSCRSALDTIASNSHGITAIVGAPVAKGGRLFNAAVIMQDGAIRHIAHKQCLPNYGVFDEQRYFSAGNKTSVIELVPGLMAGITVCEDIWCESPVHGAAKDGADIIINLNASPFHRGKYRQRIDTIRKRIDEAGLPVVYINQVGGQDELVFDGTSLVMDAHESISVRAVSYAEALVPVDLSGDVRQLRFSGEVAPDLEEDRQIYDALVLGVRDYVDKNRFSGVVLGLSGGIDSALVLVIAVDALGPERVSAVMMPSKYTADISIEDARREAEALGVEYHVIPIGPATSAFDEMLKEVFAGSDRDVTEENIQARSRGVILMAISNKQNRMVLTTGNKSEMAVGYATLYGDMAGGFAPLKDIYKTRVYRLASYRNTISSVIPERVITRAPSAELAPDQVDQDTLPPYDVLDDILHRYIEENESVDEIIAAGFREDYVRDTVRRVNLNEYKRRQAPPGIKMTEKAFGRDRRYPITFGG